MTTTLAGKVVLVTGGSRGLGAAIASALAAQGPDVAISYVVSAEKAEAVVQELKKTGVRAIAIKSDQADLSSAKSLSDAVVSHFGRLDILVNNAAIAVQGKTSTLPISTRSISIASGRSTSWARWRPRARQRRC